MYVKKKNTIFTKFLNIQVQFLKVDEINLNNKPNCNLEWKQIGSFYYVTCVEIYSLQILVTNFQKQRTI